MRVMVIIRATTDSEAGRMPEPKLLADMGRFNADLIEAGLMLDGAGLRPTSHGARVRVEDGARTVNHGPFTPVEAQISGFWIWKVRDLAEAVEWVKRCPNPHPGRTTEIEVRPLYEEEDFA